MKLKKSMLSKRVVVILSQAMLQAYPCKLSLFGIFIRKQIAAFYSNTWYERNTGYFINTYDKD